MDPIMSEQQSIEYFYQAKWPNGFRCPRCEHAHCYPITTRTIPLYECRACGHQTSLTAGTVMERSRVSLSKWAYIIHLLSQPESINAVQLSKLIRVTYKTAWSILNRIRHAISEFDVREPLTGEVRLSPSVYSSVYLLHKNHPYAYPIMLGASYDESSQPTRVKMKLVPRKHTETWNQISREGAEAFIEDHMADPPNGRATSLYGARKLQPLLGQCWHWIGETFRGISRTYLQSYIDEFCLRVNCSAARQSAADPLASIVMAS